MNEYSFDNTDCLSDIYCLERMNFDIVKDGVRYHHIMDKMTAAPADSDLASVTIIGEDGTMCDGLSTALFVMGKERAVSFQKEHPQFDVVLVTKNGDVISTVEEFKR